MRGGVDLIISTPGRLLDHVTSSPSIVKLGRVRTLVIDEADKMLDLGFEPELRRCVGLTERGGGGGEGRGRGRERKGREGKDLGSELELRRCARLEVVRSSRAADWRGGEGRGGEGRGGTFVWSNPRGGSSEDYHF